MPIVITIPVMVVSMSRVLFHDDIVMVPGFPGINIECHAAAQFDSRRHARAGNPCAVR